MATPKDKPIEDFNSLVPRVSVLERGQEAIQRDLITLSHAVKDQGLQLTNALTKLSDAHNNSFNILNEKISSTNKTDWQSFWTMIGTLAVIIAGIMAPVWMNFAAVEKNQNFTSNSVHELQESNIELIKDISILKTRIEYLHEENLSSNKRS